MNKGQDHSIVELKIQLHLLVKKFNGHMGTVSRCFGRVELALGTDRFQYADHAQTAALEVVPGSPWTDQCSPCHILAWLVGKIQS